MKTAENAVLGAGLEMLKNELAPPITAEKNTLLLDEARAKAQQLRRTFDLKRRADEAELRTLEIQRDRAQNAWRHAQANVEKMRVVSPIDGMVVLKATWKSGSMGEVQEGEEVRPGLPVLDVIDSTQMRVRARVNQADIDRLRVGQPARITSTPIRRASCRAGSNCSRKSARRARCPTACERSSRCSRSASPIRT